ncbi:PREDICTED: zinc finger BED domain-containing protein 1-like [Wasmannia auropunctata]|uniref:zinc finger BED domain-containing protein 1-like n=1 Tax=Wasmannia auropunctata TaxID=64793 RepID=UPI0005EF1155|nr:PREDICTED: zinc finger BED domain-containing protein 1-like [Wasmannia auropunctata]
MSCHNEVPSGSGMQLSIKIPRSQPRIDEAIQDVKAFEKGSFKDARITSALLYMIVKDNMPLNSTDKSGLQYFVNTAIPLYNIPGRNKITALIDAKYDYLSGLMKEKLTAASNITLTADVWTEIMNTIGYLGITAHFSNNGKISSVTIGVIELDERHTAIYLGEMLLTTCNEWDIQLSKVSVVVIDNAANICRAVCDVFGKEKQLRCFAHTLNLVPNNVFDESPNIKELINKIKNIVTYFKQSVVAADELRKAQSIDVPLKLLQDVSTRWNSTFYMLERFLILIESVSSSLIKLPKSPQMLTAFEVATINEILKMFKPFESISKEICGQKYVTCSKVIPMVNALLHELDALNPESDLGKDLKLKLIIELQKRFSDMEFNPILSIATILDPRFKRLHFCKALACSDAIQRINKLLVIVQNPDNIENVVPNADINKNKSYDIWSFHRTLAEKSQKSNQENESFGGVDLAFRQYLNLNVIDINTDPLEYWERNRHCFSKLAAIAIKYLSIVATSVPCERIFSCAGNIMDQNRDRTKPERLSKLLFLNSLQFTDWHLMWE